MFSLYTTLAACLRPSIRTFVYDGLPPAAPLAELLGVFLLHFGPLSKTGHNVIGGLVGLLCSLHRAHIIPWLTYWERQSWWCSTNTLTWNINAVPTIQKLSLPGSSGGSLGRLAMARFSLFLVACARWREWLDWLHAQQTNEGFIKADRWVSHRLDVLVQLICSEVAGWLPQEQSCFSCMASVSDGEAEEARTL